MSVKALRGLALAGSGLLIIALGSVIYGVVTWWPLASPPEAWVYGTGFVFVAGFAVALAASLKLTNQR